MRDEKDYQTWRNGNAYVPVVKFDAQLKVADYVSLINMVNAKNGRSRASDIIKKLDAKQIYAWILGELGK